MCGAGAIVARSRASEIHLIDNLILSGLNFLLHCARVPHNAVIVSKLITIKKIQSKIVVVFEQDNTNCFRTRVQIVVALPTFSLRKFYA